MPRRPKKSTAAKTPAQESRAERIAQIQREAKSKDRRNLSVIWIALAAVVILIGGLVVWAVASQPERAEVTEYDWDPETDLGHVTSRPDYATTPPAYGQHHSIWWNCGIYEDPIPDHHVVHSLEHGAIWITYQPDLPEDQVEELRGLANQPDLLMSPYPGQESPIVVTGWGRQIFLDEPSSSDIQSFVRAYVNDPAGPEPGGICYRGTETDLLPVVEEPPATEEGTETEAPGDDAVETDAPATE